ncbi:MAG: LysR family transcriptional regulator [Rhodobacteraceae bacterium]|nr:LysR family transcriptional regulator [Paracoccaceae bacterium]MAY46657.1 LysR family transcriptional regulator [Paracoccaceae bacterium]
MLALRPSRRNPRPETGPSALIRHSLRQLEYFLRVAQTGSVSRAAADLNVSQPAVSAAIAKLEETLGIQLFIRQSWQGLALTRHGRWLAASARDVLESARHLEKGAADLAERTEGRLHLGCYTTFAPLFLPGLLASFRAAYPGVDVEVHELRRAALLPRLEDGTVELALAYDTGLADRITRTELCKVPSHVLLPPDHPRAGEAAVALSELEAEPFILLDLPGSREHLLAIFAALGLSPRIAMRSESCEMVRGLVASGFGYAILNAVPAVDRALDGARLHVRPIREPVAPLSLVLAGIPGYAPGRIAQAFRAHCRAHFATLRQTGRGGIAAA